MPLGNGKTLPSPMGPLARMPATLPDDRPALIIDTSDPAMHQREKIVSLGPNRSIDWVEGRALLHIPPRVKDKAIGDLTSSTQKLEKDYLRAMAAQDVDAINASLAKLARCWLRVTHTLGLRDLAITAAALSHFDNLEKHIPDRLHAFKGTTKEPATRWKAKALISAALQAKYEMLERRPGARGQAAECVLGNLPLAADLLDPDSSLPVKGLDALRGRYDAVRLNGEIPADDHRQHALYNHAVALIDEAARIADDVERGSQLQAHYDRCLDQAGTFLHIEPDWERPGSKPKQETVAQRQARGLKNAQKRVRRLKQLSTHRPTHSR